MLGDTLEQWFQGQDCHATAVSGEDDKSLDPHDHGQRQNRNDHRGETRIHQRQSIRPPAAKFEPATE